MLASDLTKCTCTCTLPGLAGGLGFNAGAASGVPEGARRQRRRAKEAPARSVSVTAMPESAMIHTRITAVSVTAMSVTKQTPRRLSHQ